MRKTVAEKVEAVHKAFAVTVEGNLASLTGGLTAAKTFGYVGYAPTALSWSVVGIGEAGKSFTALMLAMLNYQNAPQFVKDFMFKVIAPAVWATACAFAVMEKKLFEKPGDAVLFAPTFFYDGVTKMVSAFGKYKKGEAYGSDFAAGVAMFMLAAGVSGILANENPMVALTVAGALLNLFKNVFSMPSTTPVSGNPHGILAGSRGTINEVPSVVVEPSTSNRNSVAIDESQPLLTGNNI